MNKMTRRVIIRTTSAAATSPSVRQSLPLRSREGQFAAVHQGTACAVGGYFGGPMAAAGHGMAFIARACIAMPFAEMASK